ncbi:unnamed protein product, partial [Gulo gulo]
CEHHLVHLWVPPNRSPQPRHAVYRERPESHAARHRCNWAQMIPLFPRNVPFPGIDSVPREPGLHYTCPGDTGRARPMFGRNRPS